MLEQLAAVETKVRQRRKALAAEIGRAAESGRAAEAVARSVSETCLRAGLDRADLFRRAAGSAGELATALRIARARGFITPAEFATVDAALDRSARCCGGSRTERPAPTLGGSRLSPRVGAASAASTP